MHRCLRFFSFRAVCDQARLQAEEGKAAAEAQVAALEAEFAAAKAKLKAFGNMRAGQQAKGVSDPFRKLVLLLWCGWFCSAVWLNAE